MTGLLSKLERKTGEAIAYLHDQERQGLQKFVGFVPWDHKPLLATLARQVGEDLGEPDGVIVFDPSAFPKKGAKSVGVARQWCGRLGKVDNCQVGVFMAYVARRGHALVNTRLYLPKDWAKDRDCRTAGSPGTTRWAVLRVFAGNCRCETSDTSWACRRTRWPATSTCRRRNTRGAGAIP
jgi:SRSO17 transposase